MTHHHAKGTEAQPATKSQHNPPHFSTGHRRKRRKGPGEGALTSGRQHPTWLCTNLYSKQTVRRPETRGEMQDMEGMFDDIKALLLI